MVEDFNSFLQDFSENTLSAHISTFFVYKDPGGNHLRIGDESKIPPAKLVNDRVEPSLTLIFETLKELRDEFEKINDGLTDNVISFGNAEDDQEFDMQALTNIIGQPGGSSGSSSYGSGGGDGGNGGDGGGNRDGGGDGSNDDSGQDE